MKYFQLILAVLLGGVLTAGLLLSLPYAVAAPNEGRTVQNAVVNLSPENVVVSGTQTITPVKSLMTLNNPTVLTLTLASANALEGDTLKIASEVVTNTLVQTANTNLAAVQTITQNDILDFVFVNSKWVLNNSQDNAAD